MFYTALIQAFLEDSTVFTDVKAIVDSPLKVDPQILMKACRELQPLEIMELLDAPGSDLDFPELIITPEMLRGRNQFLMKFTSHEVSKNLDEICREGFPLEVRKLTRSKSHKAVNIQCGLEESLLKDMHIRDTSGLDRFDQSNQLNQSSSGMSTLARTMNRSMTEAQAQAQRIRDKLAVVDSLDPQGADGDLETEKKLALMASAISRFVAPEGTSVNPLGLASRRMSYTSSSKNLTELDYLLQSRIVSGQRKFNEEESAEGNRIIALNYYSRLFRLGRYLVMLWGSFYRRVSPSWAPERNSLIALPRPFVVPGGRFIEIYYWDSYWIALGLLASDLHEVVRGMIENFLYCIERFGFIPNGARKYYLDRSQPPLLSNMIRIYYHHTKDVEFVRNAMVLLEREYSWWMNPQTGHTVKVNKKDVDGNIVQEYSLNRYYSLETSPRPESYRIDKITGDLYEKYHGATENVQEHWRAIRAAAESGWDFSSRWLRPAVEGQGEAAIREDIYEDKVLHKACLIDIDTTKIVPCDLNAYLFCLEEDLQYFSNLLEKKESERYYTNAKETRREAMLTFLWDTEKEIWLDYDTKTEKRSCVISAASFVPLWAGVNPGEMDDRRRLELADNLSCLVRTYGILCTNFYAGLQWDCPNAWAPNHHIAVNFLAGGRFWELEKDAATDTGPAMAKAIDWASAFVNTVLERYERSGTCSEKYHASKIGKAGVDGEYLTQDGFGWTNGSVLDFMEKFGTRIKPKGLYFEKQL